MHTQKIDVFVDEAWNQRQVSSCGPTPTIDGCADDTCPLSQTLDLVFDIFWPSEIQFCSKVLSKTNSRKEPGQHEATVVVEENQITLYLCPNWWQEPKEHHCNMINDELIL